MAKFKIGDRVAYKHLFPVNCQQSLSEHRKIGTTGIVDSFFENTSNGIPNYWIAVEGQNTFAYENELILASELKDIQDRLKTEQDKLDALLEIEKEGLHRWLRS